MTDDLKSFLTAVSIMYSFSFISLSPLRRTENNVWILGNKPFYVSANGSIFSESFVVCVSFFPPTILKFRNGSSPLSSISNVN